jgi:hypothetical protein
MTFLLTATRCIRLLITAKAIEHREPARGAIGARSEVQLGRPQRKIAFRALSGVFFCFFDSPGAKQKQSHGSSSKEAGGKHEARARARRERGTKNNSKNVPLATDTDVICIASALLIKPVH